MAFTAEATISLTVCGGDGKPSGIDEKLIPQYVEIGGTRATE